MSQQQHPNLPVSQEARLVVIERAWSAFLQALDDVPADRAGQAGVCGAWTVTDIAGHVAFWDGYVADHLPWTYGRGQEYWDAISHGAVAERHARSLDDARQELIGNHEKILRVIRVGESLDMPLLAEATFEHYDEHAEHLRVYLASLARES